MKQFLGFFTVFFGWLASASAWVVRTPVKMLAIMSQTSASSLRYHSSGMPKLPKDVVKYSQIPGKNGVFVKGKIPKGLLREHTTKVGTWGVIRVSKGQLEYIISEPTKSTHVLDTETRGIIEPTMHHQVCPITDDVEFVVEFHRKPGTGPVEEKREGL